MDIYYQCCSNLPRMLLFQKLKQLSTIFSLRSFQIRLLGTISPKISGFIFIFEHQYLKLIIFEVDFYYSYCRSRLLFGKIKLFRIISFCKKISTKFSRKITQNSFEYNYFHKEIVLLLYVHVTLCHITVC